MLIQARASLSHSSPLPPIQSKSKASPHCATAISSQLCRRSSVRSFAVPWLIASYLRQCYLLSADPLPCLGASCFSSPLLGGAVPRHRTAKQILCKAAFASPLPVHPLPFQLSGLLHHRTPPPCGSIPQRPCPLPSLFLRIALLCWAVALRVESKHRPRFFATPFRRNALPFHIGARRFFASSAHRIAVSAVASSADPCSSTHSHSPAAQVRAVP